MLTNKDLPTYSPLLLGYSDLVEMVARLPPLKMTRLRNGEVDYYGASFQIAKKLGRGEVLKINANWEHGWKYGDVRTAEHLGGYRKKDGVYLVSNEKHRTILEEAGFGRVHAVGVPYIYAPEPKIQRKKGSLLVCPGHTSNFSINDWASFAKSYAKAIALIRDDFTEVVACVTANCIERKQWIDEFESEGIPWFLGASIFDQNSLERMRTIFSRFEYVTSNIIGSHLVYAAYEGCKVSIWNWQQLYDSETYKNEPIYKDADPFLREVIEWSSFEWVSKHYAFLFHTHPDQAVFLKSWSDEQLGLTFQKSAEEIAGYFGWPQGNNAGLTREPRKCDFSLSSVSNEKMKKAGRLRKAQWKWQRKQLLNAPRYAEGHVKLFGKPFKYTDTYSLAYTIDHIFNRGIYAFPSDPDAPLIIDAGANVGVSLLYFKNRFPKAEVICFEPDQDAFSALEANVETFALTQCELHQAALWSEDSVIEFCSEGADSGVINEVGGAGVPTLVRALNLQPFLENRVVDFLKMDIEGAEIEVLKACVNGLKNVRRIFIEYHSFEGRDQRLAELFQILEGAGFRLHLNNVGLSSKQPMIGVNTYLGMDLQFDLFGYRI
jgi:FkbM family methyltransferase